MVERYDLRQLGPQGAVEKRIGLRALDAEVLAGEIHRLVVLDLKVVVVHAPGRERQLGRKRRRASVIGVLERLLLPGSRCGALLLADGGQALHGGLDGTLVDVGADPPPAKFLRHRRRRT